MVVTPSLVPKSLGCRLLQRERTCSGVYSGFVVSINGTDFRGVCNSLALVMRSMLRADKNCYN